MRLKHYDRPYGTSLQARGLYHARQSGQHHTFLPLHRGGAHHLRRVRRQRTTARHGKTVVHFGILAVYMLVMAWPNGPPTGPISEEPTK